jgi:hypothetical protein
MFNTYIFKYKNLSVKILGKPALLVYPRYSNGKPSNKIYQYFPEDRGCLTFFTYIIIYVKEKVRPEGVLPLKGGGGTRVIITKERMVNYYSVHSAFTRTCDLSV